MRLEPLLLPELGQHLPRRRVRVDRSKDDLTRGDVVGVVHVAAAIPHRRVHRENDVGLVDPDLPRDRAPNVDRGLEVAVLEL